MPAGLDGNPHPVATAARAYVIQAVTEEIERCRQPGRACLVAVDGIDGSGKSTFADELAVELAKKQLRALRSTIDSFHNCREVRWQRGRDSPLGFYLDSHNINAVQELLLEPLRTGVGA